MDSAQSGRSGSPKPGSSGATTRYFADSASRNGFHAVDSSEMAFQMAGKIAMGQAMPKCQPVLLEPIFHVAVLVPTEFTAQVQRLLSGRRGQILGFESREGWKGWDQISALLPQVEINDLIIELRSLSRGVATYDYRFENLHELSGKLADDVVAQAAE